MGYGICHRIPERSFFIGGHQLPLCARCTGTFLGSILGLTVMLLLRRHRASRLPPIAVLGVLVMFTGLWAFDGVNSYLSFFPGLPNLYEPRNWLRLTTGMLNGLTLVIFAFPIFNFTLWREPTEERVIRNIWELLAIVPVVAFLVLVIQAEPDVLLYPLALLSSLGVLVMLTLINTISRSTKLPWVRSLTLITSMRRRNCLMICSKIISSPVTTIVILETSGSTVSPTDKLSIL